MRALAPVTEIPSTWRPTNRLSVIHVNGNIVATCMVNAFYSTLGSISAIVHDLTAVDFADLFAELESSCPCYYSSSWSSWGSKSLATVVMNFWRTSFSWCMTVRASLPRRESPLGLASLASSCSMVVGNWWSR